VSKVVEVHTNTARAMVGVYGA